jgi:hypothetical protein
MILNIPNNGEFKLEFENDNLTKFSMCRLSYQNNNFSVIICEDYVYIYQFNDKIWIEFNKGYDESSKMSPHEFYRNPSHYRILLVELPRATLYEWKKTLEKIRTCYLLD